MQILAEISMASHDISFGLGGGSVSQTKMNRDLEAKFCVPSL